MLRITSFAFFAVALSAAAPLAARSPLHTWTDKDGVVHLDDVGPVRERSAKRASPRAPGKTSKADR